MSNSFASPPPLADPQTVVAGQPISYGAINSIGQTLNYCFARGGITKLARRKGPRGHVAQSRGRSDLDQSVHAELCEKERLRLDPTHGHGELVRKQLNQER